jgi:hypothetical protein
MPTQHGFRLEDTDDIPELICGLARRLLELGGQDGQRQFLYLAGSDWMFMFALQDGQLLTKNKYLQVFFLVR